MNKNNLKLAIKLRHELHQHPELSNKETWTKQHLIKFLKENTNLEIVDRGNWFYAIYRAGEDKDNIAFRAELDALAMEEIIDIPHASKFSGVAHKCGHDGHAAILAGFALEIDQNGANKNVFFLFQHAEETGDGAAEAVVFIKENNIDEIFACHNKSGLKKNSINVIDGTSNFASRGVIISMTGLPTHASQPEFGKNPAYSISKIITEIDKLTNSNNNKGLVLCTVIQVDIGEESFGNAAYKGRLLLTIRAEFEDELDKLQDNLEYLAKQLAKKDDIGVNFEYTDIFPMTFNHKTSNDKIRQAAEKKGFKLFELEYPERGSEDFGHYLKKTKGAYCFIGNGEDYPQIHTTEFDFPDDIIETAVELFKAICEI